MVWVGLLHCKKGLRHSRPQRLGTEMSQNFFTVYETCKLTISFLVKVQKIYLTFHMQTYQAFPKLLL